MESEESSIGDRSLDTPAVSLAECKSSVKQAIDYYAPSTTFIRNIVNAQLP